MRQPSVLCPALLSVLALTSTARAATYFASPTGTATSDCYTRANACDLGSAGSIAQPGDTVLLLGGVYSGGLYVSNSGTADAWITFKAADCETPIFEGAGSPPTDAEDQSGGVHSQTGEYLHFDGIVVRGFNIGFGNAWAGGVDSDEVSNGHWIIENSIAYMNGRTGFTFFSAENFTLKNSISAHNGSSSEHSWSSGVTLFEATGELLVERVVSFENMDAEQHTDGSGFIVDENANGALIRNSLAFRNGGSCLRLTESSGLRFLNNTCFHNAQDPQANSPGNPSEVYFTVRPGVSGSSETDPREGISFLNNIFLSNTTSRAPQVIQNKPTSGWSNNLELRTEMESQILAVFTAPTAETPNFTPPPAASSVVGQGTSGANVPTDDLGLDPKCLVKRAPGDVGQIAKGSWWQYDIDIDYVVSIGGVAQCFNPGARAATPDLGSYQAGTVATAPACVPGPDPIPPDLGTGGASGAGGGSATGSGGDAAVGAGGDGSGGPATGAGGADASGAGGTAPGSGDPGASGGGPGDPTGAGANGCGCRIPAASRSSSLGAFALLALAAFGVGRRRVTLRRP